MNDILATIILTTLLILLLIAGVVIVIFIANRRHTQQQISIAQMQVDYEKELRTVEQEVQEEVLLNVSRELHDNIGQLLTVMHMQMEQEKLQKPEVINPMSGTLQDTIQQVRMLGRSLNNEWLEQNGLTGIINNEVSRLRQLDRLKIHWNHDNLEPKLEKDQRVMVFRMFQEIINNALKHSGAENIYIELKGSDGFYLTVKDDGNGFDTDEIKATGKGSGLRNMEKRASLSHIDFEMIAAKGKGSTFILKIKKG